jgi:retron-type reverse transcriptase
VTRKICVHKYDDIISVENLLLAWKEFLVGKTKKTDVQEFQLRLSDNIFDLQYDLKNKVYSHSKYFAFKVNDPKPRDIHKASVRDRLLHHAIYRILYPFFNNTFIADSFSCRLGKGTHRAVKRLNYFYGKVSKNNTKQVWALKCDIRKFFDSINHEILLSILDSYIEDKEIMELLRKIISSFYKKEVGCGLPLGNLTSQLFVNIYMNVFDQFVKHKIRAKYYIRYSDDFIILSDNKKWLEGILIEINRFLSDRLKLSLHPNKVYIKTFSSGVDFLGWINFADFKILRKSTKKRMFRGLLEKGFKKESVQSYLGLLSHGNEYKTRSKITSSLIE